VDLGTADAADPRGLPPTTWRRRQSGGGTRGASLVPGPAGRLAPMAGASDPIRTGCLRREGVVEEQSLRSRPLALPIRPWGLAITITGSYGFGWSWSGVSSNGDLWDWQRLLVLPSVVGLSPLWCARRTGRTASWRTGSLLAIGLVGFAVVVLGGYGMGWSWTGFAGNKLGDWIELLVVHARVPIVFSRLSLQLGEREAQESLLASAEIAPTEVAAPPQA